MLVPHVALDIEHRVEITLVRVSSLKYARGLGFKTFEYNLYASKCSCWTGKQLLSIGLIVKTQYDNHYCEVLLTNGAMHIARWFSLFDRILVQI